MFPRWVRLTTWMSQKLKRLRDDALTTVNSHTKEQHGGLLKKAVIIAFFILVAVISLIVLIPPAPKEIALLTGTAGSSDHELGVSLAGYLKEEGLHVSLKTTSGAKQKLQMLASGAENTVAFLPVSTEMTLDDSADTSRLVSLGSVSYQPLWLFYRNELQIQSIPDLRGYAVALGNEDSVVGHVSRFLLEINDITGQVKSNTLTNTNPVAITRALQDGKIDAAFAVGQPSSGNISALLSDEDITFLSFERADAYLARNKALSKHRVPEGVFDLANNIPSRDMMLLGITTNLVTIDSFYPTTVPILLKAISKIDVQPASIDSARSFPNAENVTLPLAKTAVRYYNQGEKGLSKFLPYKITRWLNHLGFVVLPLLTIVFVLLKIVSILVKVRASIRFNGFYKRLESIDKARVSGAEPLLIHREIDELDKACSGLSVPRSMREQHLNLCQLVHDMRERLPELE